MLNSTTSSRDAGQHARSALPGSAGRTFEYFINCDERGEFRADVRDPNGTTVFEVEGFEIFEDGFMKHKNDLTGLAEYLGNHLGILSANDTLVSGN